MPELPEVETIKRTLEPLVVGKYIENVRMLRNSVIKHPLPDEFAQKIVNRRIESLGRRGKYLLVNLSGGYTLVVHLRMTGHFVCAEHTIEAEKHTHVIFELNDGYELRFSDVRRFGCLWLIASGELDDFTGMSRLGPDAWGGYLSAEHLKKVLAKRKISIKQGLLDQSVVAGLGNIYVDEVLFACGVSPLRKTSSITDGEWCKLAEIIPQILGKSIENKGTTFSDYVDGEGKKGYHVVYLDAYGRAGKPCRRCGDVLVKEKIAGRGTVYCPNCQK